MTEKELKKLNRYQLLQLLIAQTERADQLQAQLDATQERLDDQNVELSSLGSIAEASLKVNKVFEAAQAAADLYIESAKKQAEEILAEAEEQARRIKEQ